MDAANDEAQGRLMLLNLPATDPNLAIFGRRLRAARKARGVEQQWLADKAETPKLTLALAEQGRARLGSADLYRVINALGLPLDFFEGDPDLSKLRPFY